MNFLTRSQFLRLAARAFALAILLPLRAFSQSLRPVATAETGEPNGKPPGMTPRVMPPENGDIPPITPNARFYIEDISGPPAALARGTGDWRLRLTGRLNRPLTLTYRQILERPAVERIITLSCIGNPVGGHALGTARWQGVPLGDLLAEADPHFFARTLIFRGEDGYHDSLPLKAADHPGALLAYKMNGQILPLAHGYPLRLLVPGFYGIKQMKWLSGIEVTDQDHQGYWQKRNWSPEGRVRIFSRIDWPAEGDWLFSRQAVVRGIAFAGDRGIQYVQVSLDGERSWHLARLETPLSPYSWVFWSLPVTFRKPGRYSLAVRAADQYSGVQQDDHRDPFPAGVSGWHRIQIKVA